MKWRSGTLIEACKESNSWKREFMKNYVKTTTSSNILHSQLRCSKQRKKYSSQASILTTYVNDLMMSYWEKQISNFGVRESQGSKAFKMPESRRMRKRMHLEGHIYRALILPSNERFTQRWR